MKVGNIPIIWTVMTVTFIRWAEQQLRRDREARTRTPVASIANDA